MAIDPARLQAQTGEVAGSISDPARLRRKLAALFEEYQVGRRKAGKTVFTVPKPVLRTQARALIAAVAGAEDTALKLVGMLWEMDRPEARQLSIQIMGAQRAAFVPELAESWATQRLPIEQLEQLADRGLAEWRQSDRAGFLRRCADWLGGNRSALALFALHAAAGDGSISDLPSVLQLVQGFTNKARGRIRRALILLLESLAAEIPMETVHFLLEEVAQGGPASRRLVREIMPQLPANVRKVLESRGGIMRRVSVREQQ
jgi:hypothetical protein